MIKNILLIGASLTLWSSFVMAQAVAPGLPMKKNDYQFYGAETISIKVPLHPNLKNAGISQEEICSKSEEILNSDIDTEKVNRHKPSVEVMFDSIRENYGNSVVTVMLTGMGADGAAAMSRLKQKGSPTIAQDEASSVVWGMPQAAIELGAADHVLPLSKIAEKMLHLAK